VPKSAILARLHQAARRGLEPLQRVVRRVH
jgi:hypothetical protein